MLTKPRDPTKMLQNSASPRRKRRFSPLMLIGMSVSLAIALIAGIVFVLPHLRTHAAQAAANPNCTLTVPANPLSAQGLATPYQLTATNPAQGPCNEANANQSAFVQGAILDPATGQMSTYSPLVIDKGTQPAVAPTPPTLPANAVVALWFGFNGTTLTLANANANNNNGNAMGNNGNQNNNGNAMGNGAGNTPATPAAGNGNANNGNANNGNNNAAAGNGIQQGNCVNGANGSPFGQFAYCNAPAFFQAANAAIQAGQLKVPAVGMAKDGLPCPTTRDFSVVDQDQSDNVQTQYLANGNGQTAQATAANQGQVQNATTLGNPSDNALLSKFIDPALGCTPPTVPDLANNGNMALTLAMNELQAAANQQAPIALVPANDPMTLNNNNQNLNKTNLYRAGVDQPAAAAAADASGTTYCQNLFNPQTPNTGILRVAGDMNLTINATTPNAQMANNLFNFLAMRLNQSFTNLGCGNLLNMQNPVTLQMDGNGVTIGATITVNGRVIANSATNNGKSNGNGTACATPAAGAGAGAGTGTGAGNGAGNGAGTGAGNGAGTGAGNGAGTGATGTGTGTTPATPAAGAGNGAGGTGAAGMGAGTGNTAATPAAGNGAAGTGNTAAGNGNGTGTGTPCVTPAPGAGNGTGTGNGAGNGTTTGAPPAANKPFHHTPKKW